MKTQATRNEEEIKVKLSATTNMLWPYHGEKKAFSASTLTNILKQIEYENKQIPQSVLIRAANNGRIFHRIIQDFLENGNDKNSFSQELGTRTITKIRETISFFKKNQFGKFIGSEKLYHSFYKENFFASYVDLEFENCIIELKTNNIIIDQSPMSVLAFKIQLLIQKICTKKDVYLLWSTGKGIFFEKFKEGAELFEILEILIDIVVNKDIYSFATKKEIIKRLLLMYTNSSSTKRILEKWEDSLN